MYISKKPFVILFIVIVLIFSCITVYAAAKPDFSGQTIYACAKDSGQITLTDGSTSCGNNEQKISWNVVGPQGPIGLMGPQGPAGKDGVNGKDGADGAVGPAVYGTAVNNYDVYMRIGGVKGESKDANYEDWIVLSGVQIDASQTVTIESGGGSGAGKAEFNEFVVKKLFDASSIPLFMDMLKGTHLADGEIVFVSRGPSPAPILRIKLTDVLITRYNFDNTNEAIILNFTKIDLTYSGITPPIQGIFDMKLNK
ncbi:hypothetical protein DVH26_10010 [Paenibacillus sp. H1-7]|uniref:Hcp family type VI secretion system effector n=1 Tax=Paenibacillus sp. H1-7 TaxID=2282849 RepID=UPI001EF931B8|nr:type VI secretion system tube protein Hcp [Paenibacillus sp. H1-7]ULL14754.1 hypothetical protein DVH26_10010 [Paenibacillus sp. H1-7]